ncbi:MAG: hypothetical protein HKN74_13695 [Acidimicrobiia bacterium]|nr:hypothetical protein [Acidimicrobiia bacterium]NNF11329.1 hypothetical protein [Acidimicrobiia bacterium]NNL70701.1 hypothetical protein [Acidimicrobiia bacterium]
MSERILQGPFLTRKQAARRAGTPPDVLKHRPDLLVVEGEWLPEVYFAFQFDESGVRSDVAAVVKRLKPDFSDLAIEDWLVRPHRSLGLISPLRALNRGSSVDQVLAAAERDGPHPHAAGKPPGAPGRVPGQPPTPARRSQHRRWRSLRPALHGR